jgi:hypothetical protein
MTLLKKLLLGAVACTALLSTTPAHASWWHHRRDWDGDRGAVVVARDQHRHVSQHETIAVSGHRRHVESGR